MAPVELPYLNLFRDRKGRTIAHYRRGGVRRRLVDVDGTYVDGSDPAALARAWQIAHDAYGAADTKAAAAGAARAASPQSIADLIGRYRASPEWAEKKPETKRDYEKALVPLETDWGHLPVAGLRRKHVGAIRDRYAWRSVPDPADAAKVVKLRNVRQANRVITTLSILLSYAVDPLGWREDNPALRPRRLRGDGDGYRPWNQAEFAQFRERADEEWRFAALLALLTGQRGQDQVEMRWADYDGGFIRVTQQKGRGTVKLQVPCHPALREALDARRAAIKDRTPVPLTLLCRPDGSKWIANAFQKAAGKAIRAAGLTGIVWHGLRGATASWAAEGGATDQEIGALLGHRQVQTTRHYSRGAADRRLAGQASAAIVVPFGTAENIAETESDKRQGAKVTNTRSRPR